MQDWNLREGRASDHMGERSSCNHCIIAEELKLVLKEIDSPEKKCCSVLRERPGTESHMNTSI